MSNLRKYWREHIFGHFGVAALSGYLSWQNPAAGLLFAGQCVRQVAGYWQKRDTVSIDLAWCVAGFATGLAVGAVFRAVGVPIGGADFAIA